GYLAKSPCGGKSATSGLGSRSPSKCSSTGPHFPSNGGFMPCQNDEGDSESALLLRAAKPLPTRPRCMSHSAQICHMGCTGSPRPSKRQRLPLGVRANLGIKLTGPAFRHSAV